MDTLNLRTTHAPVKKYFEALKAFEKLGVTHETAVRSAFRDLLTYCCHKLHWTLVPEDRHRAEGGNQIAPGHHLRRIPPQARIRAAISLGSTG